ncbi:hypothetical protein NDU88_007994 [Pleurodeles waltl]|uniref:Uncharacterized protein n=1 Tax=Pleurodeles waltl TaxID=8319 RepID=A0AAV7QMA3_PLEWA|nr:hypothetical protein NDU88_007994 [Pleurodeles waltl]
MQVGGSLSEANVQEEPASLDKAPDAWSEEWYIFPEDTGKLPQPGELQRNGLVPPGRKTLKTQKEDYY